MESRTRSDLDAALELSDLVMSERGRAGSWTGGFRIKNTARGVPDFGAEFGDFGNYNASIQLIFREESAPASFGSLVQQAKSVVNYEDVAAFARRDDLATVVGGEDCYYYVEWMYEGHLRNTCDPEFLDEVFEYFCGMFPTEKVEIEITLRDANNLLFVDLPEESIIAGEVLRVTVARVGHRKVGEIWVRVHRLGVDEYELILDDSERRKLGRSIKSLQLGEMNFNTIANVANEPDE